MTLTAQAGPLWRIVSTRIPSRYAVFQVHGVERDISSDQVEIALAIVLGDPTEGAPLLRIHSQRFTGEVLGSLRCDCNDQLEMAMRTITEEGCGLIIFEYQEGRGTGLVAKLQAYELQDAGLDTIEVNHALGLKADCRDFSLPAAIWHDLGIRRVRLLSNNPHKSRALSGAEIEVVALLPREITPTPYSFSYLLTKKEKLGHVPGLQWHGQRYATNADQRNQWLEAQLQSEGQTMTGPQFSDSKPTSANKSAVGRLFVLELSAGRIHSMNPDGSDKKTIVTDCRLCDGIVVDVEARHIYWTNMGVPSLNDGSIERADLDGKNRKVIVPQGGTFTPKQIHLDKKNGKLYWCDREGMRVMRSNLDGSRIEVLVEAGRDDSDRCDQTRWCVGITIDAKREKIYWTQKGPDNGNKGRIFRANLEIPKGETPAQRTDIEVFFDALPEPIDLELDLEHRVLYWTDRGDPPRGNTVNRAAIDVKPKAPEILVTHLMEGIGIALDVPGDRMFVTDFAGSIYSAKLDGSGERNFLYAQGNLTGIAYAEI